MIHKCRLRTNRSRLFGSQKPRACQWVSVAKADNNCGALSCAMHRLSYELGRFYRSWAQPAAVYDFRTLLVILYAARQQVRKTAAPLRKPGGAAPYRSRKCTESTRRSVTHGGSRVGARSGSRPGSSRPGVLHRDQVIDCVCSKLLQTLRLQVTTWAQFDRAVDDAITEVEGYNPPVRVISYSLFWGGARGVGFQGMQHSLKEYAFGLWRSIPIAAAMGWLVCVYHDGSVDPVLRRFWATFPPNQLRTVRVILPADLHGHKYAGCLLRLLAADDPAVDVFLLRDLDDPLDAAGLQMVTDRWLPRRRSAVHIQSEPYHTPQHRNMANMGWYGQRNTTGGPSVVAHMLQFLRREGSDHYCADEEFLTHVWLKELRRENHSGIVMKLPSHPYRSGVAPEDRDAAFQTFWQRKPVPPRPPGRDVVLDLSHL